LTHCKTFVGVLIVILLTLTQGQAAASGALVAFELEVHENTLDGCTSCGCRIKGEFEPGKRSEWWIAFGLVKPAEQQGWAAAGASSHCGKGTFGKVAGNFTKTLGNPYIILDLSTSATLEPDGVITLDTKLTSKKLTGFSKKERPRYQQHKQTRTLTFSSDDTRVLPVLVPDNLETQVFAVHDVLLGLRATTLGQHADAVYGSILVTADLPGAEILLDGGFAGRTGWDQATLLTPVNDGTRELLVRDYSGREASAQVKVESGSTIEVSLQVLDLASRNSDNGIIPIGTNPQGFQEFWRITDGAMLVSIPEGEFLMGSLEGEGEKHEQPQHRVYVSSFLIEKTEVTVRQYLKYAKDKGISPPPEPIWGWKPDYAISFILWHEAQAFCEWTGGRLPTEAEWEKAARGTDGRKYPWGDNWDATRCNSIAGGLHQPESVGYSKSCLSPYGVLDMSGGVQEWTADRYGENYYSESAESNPTGPETGRMRVMRGGGWMSQPTWIRPAYRARRSPTSRNMDHGFRCVKDMEEEA
jgi:formylglycine-generating enzyme required for sulfatase activity